MSKEHRFYVGTYTNGRKEGIYRCMLQSTGAITVEAAEDAGPSPSFLAADSRGRFLFAVNEISEYDGGASGAVSAFAIDPASGALQLLNRRPSHGISPCHVVVDRTDRFVLAANYTSGSVAVFPIRTDGSLSEASDLVQHTGSSINKKRQEGPHAHCVAMSGDNALVYVVDLGIDKIIVYRFDGNRGKLHPAQPPWIVVEPGTGPRHVALDRSGRWMYLVNELSPTLMAFSLTSSPEEARRTQTIRTVPEDYAGDTYGAAVVTVPSGKRVYSSNRGHNSIAVFACDAKTGRLSTVQHQSTGGDWPRSFAIDPDEKYLLVANQRSHTLTVFAIDPEKGTLTPAGQQAEIPSPVCILFA